MCYTGDQGLLIPPTDKALITAYIPIFYHLILIRKRLALLIRISILFQLCAAGCYFAVNRMIDGAVVVFAAVMGLTELSAVGNGFNLQSMLCYFAMNVIFTFWAGVRGAFFLMGKEAPMYALTGWQSTVYFVALVSDVALFSIITMLTFMLIRELRAIVGHTAQVIRFFTDGTLTGVTDRDLENDQVHVNVDGDDEVRRAAREVDTTSSGKGSLFTGSSYKLVD